MSTNQARRDPCGLEVRPARTLRERRSAAEMACRTLHEECRGEPWSEHPDPIEALGLALSASLTIAAWQGSRPVATASVHRPDPGRARSEGTQLGLPCERVVTLEDGAFGDLPIAHGSHAVCLKAWRQRGLLDQILEALLAASSDCALITIAATWTRNPGEAAGLWEQLAGDDLDAGHRIRPRDPQTGVGEHEPIHRPIPWLIRFYQRLGFELAGEPVFIEAYDQYALPMVRMPG